MTRLTTCPDPDSVASRAAAHVRRQLERAREERGVAHIALSGGNTPRLTFQLLAEDRSDWEGVEVWFADERCVGPQDDESNYRMAEQALLEPAQLDQQLVHRMMGELGPDEGAERYGVELAARVPPLEPGGPPALDVIVLGIGPDGHVASLFPGAPTLDAADTAVCLGVHDSPKPPPERITLSMPVLRAARGCLLLASGTSKADAVSAMLAEPSRHVPASLLRRSRLTVIVDDAAAPAGPSR